MSCTWTVQKINLDYLEYFYENENKDVISCKMFKDEVWDERQHAVLCR